MLLALEEAMPLPFCPAEPARRKESLFSPIKAATLLRCNVAASSARALFILLLRGILGFAFGNQVRQFLHEALQIRELAVYRRKADSSAITMSPMRWELISPSMLL